MAEGDLNKTGAEPQETTAGKQPSTQLPTVPPTPPTEKEAVLSVPAEAKVQSPEMSDVSLDRVAEADVPLKQFVVPPPIKPPQQNIERDIGSVLKKEFPLPASLTEKKAVLPPLPSNVSLEDIPLPESMKGPHPMPSIESSTSAPKPHDPLVMRAIESSGSRAKIEDSGAPTQPFGRSMRELGLEEKPHLRKDMKVVSVNTAMRTELNADGLPRIRTYAADLSDEIKKRGANLSTIIGAERERMAREEERQHEREMERARQARQVFFLGGGSLLLLLGVIVIVAAVWYSRTPDAPTPLPSIIATNNRVIAPVDETSVTLSKFLADARLNASLSLGEIEEIIITESGFLLPPQEFVTRIGLPPQLARNTTYVMAGVHAFDRNQPFLILKINSYDLAFGAMLNAERWLAESMGEFFAPLNAPAVIPELSFEDRVFQNIDVRVSGNVWPLIYMFPSQDILIITTNESTLKEVLARLSVSALR